MTTEATMVILRRVAGAFPGPVSCSFAYGSAVFEQSGGPGSGMLDLVFAVPDSRAWHAANLARHRAHYSGLAGLGPAALARIQDADWPGAGVYFNTLVNVQGRRVKYGVVHVDSLLRDLTEWRWLYLAGRLHKPVAWIQAPGDARVLAAVEANRAAALAAGLLLLLPEHRFSQGQLLAAVCGLSYGGDVRMAFAEDRGKVKNISVPQAPLLAAMYRPLAASRMPWLVWPEPRQDGADVQLEWAADPAQLASVVACLPAGLDLLGGGDSDPAAALRRRLCGIVFRSSLGQTVKSAVTAGVAKSARYGGAKVSKWFKSLWR